MSRNQGLAGYLLNDFQMKVLHRLAIGCVGCVVLAGGLVYLNWDRMPWVGLHFIHRDAQLPSRWSLELKLQEGREVAPAGVGLDKVPALNKQASLLATLAQEGRSEGYEVHQAIRLESIESIQYSWEQKHNRELLVTRWEARVGPLGGLRSLQIVPTGKSVWTRHHASLPWVFSMWPQFVKRGLEPGASWSGTSEFKIEAPELNEPVAVVWDYTWTYRGQPPNQQAPLALLEAQGKVRDDRQRVQGTLRAEVIYSILDQKVAGCRGAFQVQTAAPVQPGEGLHMTLLENLQGQFQVVRLIPGATATPSSGG